MATIIPNSQLKPLVPNSQLEPLMYCQPRYQEAAIQTGTPSASPDRIGLGEARLYEAKWSHVMWEATKGRKSRFVQMWYNIEGFLDLFCHFKHKLTCLRSFLVWIGNISSRILPSFKSKGSIPAPPSSTTVLYLKLRSCTFGEGQVLHLIHVEALCLGLHFGSKKTEFLNRYFPGICRTEVTLIMIQGDSRISL